MNQTSSSVPFRLGLRPIDIGSIAQFKNTSRDGKPFTFEKKYWKASRLAY
jgi:hypothetical protein